MAFNASGEDCMSRLIDASYVSVESHDIDRHYDIDATVKWLAERNVTKVCLQFPDELLKDSVAICKRIRHLTNCKVYIVADSTYDSCCVDEVSAKHVDGEAIVHYGNSCLSTCLFPVFYVFPKRQLDIAKTVQTLKERSSAEQTTVVVYDIAYHHLADDLCDNIFRNLPRVIIGKIYTDREIDTETVCGRSLTNSSNERVGLQVLQGSVIVYIGTEGPTVFNLTVSGKENTMKKIWRQFKALMWKNMKIYGWKQVLPFIISLVLLFWSKIDFGEIKTKSDPSFLYQKSNIDNIYYSQNQSEFIRNLMDKVSKKLNHDTINMFGYTDEKTILKIREHYLQRNNQSFAVIFEITDDLTKQLNYTIRNSNSYRTDCIFPIMCSEIPEESYGTIYSAFAILQLAIDSAYIEAVTGKPVTKQFTVQPYVYKSPTHTKKFLLKMRNNIQLPIIINLFFFVVFLINVALINCENTSGIYELSKVKKVSSWLIRISQYVTVFQIIHIVFQYNQLPTKFSGWILSTLVILAASYVLLLSFAVTTCFDTTQRTYIVYILFWILFQILFVILTDMPVSHNFILFLLLSIIPGYLTFRMFEIISIYEMKDESFQWDNLFSMSSDEDDISFAFIWILLLAQSVGCFFLICYMDQTNFGKLLCQLFGCKKQASEIMSFDIKKRAITVIVKYKDVGNTTSGSIKTATSSSENVIKLNGTNRQNCLNDNNLSIGYCPQTNTIISNLTVRQQIVFNAKLEGLKPDHVRTILDQCDLINDANKMVDELSQLLKQKVKLAIAMAGDPSLLVLDEPTLDLDINDSRVIWKIIRKLNEQCTILIITLKMEEAEVLANQVLILNEGKLEELKTAPGADYKIYIDLKESSNTNVISKIKEKTNAIDDVPNGEPQDYVVIRVKEKDLTDILQLVEENKNNWNIVKIRVSSTTLEDDIPSVTSKEHPANNSNAEEEFTRQTSHQNKWVQFNALMWKTCKSFTFRKIADFILPVLIFILLKIACVMLLYGEQQSELETKQCYDYLNQNDSINNIFYSSNESEFIRNLMEKVSFKLDHKTINIAICLRQHYFGNVV